MKDYDKMSLNEINFEFALTFHCNPVIVDEDQIPEDIKKAIRAELINYLLNPGQFYQEKKK